MYKSNMSHKQMKQYLEELMGKELIDKNKSDGNFILTEKGFKFLQKLREMREFERTFGI